MSGTSHMTYFLLLLLMAFSMINSNSQTPSANETRPRVREAGIKVGILPPGPVNAMVCLPASWAEDGEAAGSPYLALATHLRALAAQLTATDAEDTDTP